MKKEDFDIKIFSARFSALLKQSEENTHTIAKKIGLNPATISRYTKGIMTPKLITLYAIADIFEVNPLWLMGFDVPEKEEQSNGDLSAPKKIYTIIGGVNGTGKSSLTGVLKAEINDLGTIIDVDKLNIKYGDKLKGGKEAVKLISDCIESGLSFTQETTLSGHKTTKTAQRAKDNGYYIRLYYVGISSVDESLKRIANRVSKGGHDIPPTDVIRRFNSRYADIAVILPLCDEAIFYDNENGFKAVAEYKEKAFKIIVSPAPEWVSELSKYLKGKI